MIRIRKRSDLDQQKSQYKNIIVTQTDNDGLNVDTNRISKQQQVLSKNFSVLQQFLQAFKNEGLQKQIVQLACTADFKQQWQNKRKQNHQLKYSYFFRQNFVYLILNIFLLIFDIVLVWFLSVFRVFRYQDNQSVFLLCLIIQFFDIGIKSVYIIFYKFKKQNSNQFQIKKKDWFQICLGNIYCFFYSVLGLTTAIKSTQHQFLIIFDILAIALTYYRIQDILQDVKMIKSSPQFKNYLKLFNLMTTLIMIIHFFACLMFFSTNFATQHYLNLIQFNQPSWINLYIYSFYFSGTTVLTVGYGDILPKNIIQIFIVLLMQIFGVVMIVYLNGQVGNILCSLRRQKQNLQNDLSVLQRLKTNFKLSFETTQKIRQYLIDNRRTNEQNQVHQQKTLLQKISSDLRQQAIMTNHINVIKQSLFLLINFSIKVQIQISHKLIHIIYSPNEKIPQIMGKQKIFLIKRGEVSLYVSKKDNQNQNSRKIVKTISISSLSNSQCNSFGYVSLITGRLNRLKMFANDFSSCYYIQKPDFIEAVQCDNKDFEKYNQMRQAYINQKEPEKNEADQFFDEKDHYVCKISKVISQYLKQRHQSQRKNILRKNKRKRLILEGSSQDQNCEQSESEIQSIPSRSDSKQIKIQIVGIKNVKSQNSCLTLNQRKRKYKIYNQQEQKQSVKNLVVQRKYAKRYCKNAYTKKKVDQLMHSTTNHSENLGSNFETGSNYSYFYPDFNLDMVMRKQNYYLNLLSVFTNWFEQTLAEVKRQQNPNNGEVMIGSSKNIQKYRRQKKFIESINIAF